MLSVVIHGSSGEQTVISLQTHQHYQRPDTHTGECELSKHQFGHINAVPEKSQAALLPQRSAREGVRREVPRLSAQQLPQPPALLAASLPQQRQRQHLPGEQLLYPLQLLEGDGVGAAGL